MLIKYYIKMSLIINIQTTGLCSENDASYKDLLAYDSCRIVSIAWLLKTKNNINDYKYYIIKPKDFSITPDNAVNFHSITHTYALRYGVSIKKIIKELNKIMDNIDTISCYNNTWVCNILKSEKDHELIKEIESKKMKCVLELSKSYIKSKYFVTMETSYSKICNKEIYVKYNSIYNVIVSVLHPFEINTN
jgi:hypothetical protein